MPYFSHQKSTKDFQQVSGSLIDLRFSICQKTSAVAGNAYSCCELMAMEWLVQEVLNIQCLPPTRDYFLWYNNQLQRNDKYLEVLALLGHEQLSIKIPCQASSTMMDVASSSKKLAHDTGDQDVVAYSLVATSAQKPANVEERKPLRLAIVTVYRSSDFRTEPADRWLQYPPGTILVQPHPTMTREEIDRLQLAIEQSGYTNIILIPGGGEEGQQQQPIEEAGHRNISPTSWLIPVGLVSGIVVVIGSVAIPA